MARLFYIQEVDAKSYPRAAQHEPWNTSYNQ